jgi:putative mRNA 3-end processing factor
MPILETTPRGLYCPAGDFYVDPWQPVRLAIITHAHSDHAHEGSANYLTAADGVGILRERVGHDVAIQGLAYGESLTHNGVRLSLHPAGHILGSAQVRIEIGGQVCVVSGDYKLAPDSTCRPFEVLRCNTFVSESTFGLPIYRWPPAAELFAELNGWWKLNQQRGRTSIVYAYSLGKAQRVLAALEPDIGPILVHGAVERFLPLYRAAGVALPATQRADLENSRAMRGRAIVVAPPSAAGSPWTRKFGPAATAMASGWMQLRGARRRRSVDRGFALSDHADWDGLLSTIAATEADDIWVTHGYTGVMVRWLAEQGKQARAIATQFEGELEDEPISDDPASAEGAVEANVGAGAVEADAREDSIDAPPDKLAERPTESQS